MIYGSFQLVLTGVFGTLVAIAVVSFGIGLYRCYKFIEDIHDELCG